MGERIYSTSIILKTCWDVKRFIEIISKTKGKVTAKQFSYTVDAKSILGVISLDTNIPITLHFENIEDDEFDYFLKVFKKEKWEV